MAPAWLLIHRPERLTPSLGNVPPSSCSYAATLRTASAVILPCIISALPLGSIRGYGHAAAITTGTSAATIPCIQPISTTTGSGGPILRADVHTELAMPDRGLHHTSSLCQRDCSDLAAQPEAVVQAAPIWRHPYQWLLFFGWVIFARNGQPLDWDSFHHPSSAIIAMLIYQKQKWSHITPT